MKVSRCKPSAPRAWPWGQRSRRCSSRDQQAAPDLGSVLLGLHTHYEGNVSSSGTGGFPKGPCPKPHEDQLCCSFHQGCVTLASPILTHGNSHAEESQTLLLLKDVGFESSRI